MEWHLNHGRNDTIRFKEVKKILHVLDNKGETIGLYGPELGEDHSIWFHVFSLSSRNCSTWWQNILTIYNGS